MKTKMRYVKTELVDIEEKVNEALEELQEHGAKMVKVSRPYAVGISVVVPIQFEAPVGIERRIEKAREERVEIEKLNLFSGKTKPEKSTIELLKSLKGEKE